MKLSESWVAEKEYPRGGKNPFLWIVLYDELFSGSFAGKDPQNGGITMKRFRLILGLLLLALLLAFACQAGAAPVLTDQNTTAWIGAENHLYLMNAAGEMSHMPMVVMDILSFSEDSVFCRMNTLQVYAIKRDGTGSQLVQNPDQIANDARLTLENGQLVIGSLTIPQVEAAATDGTHVCVVTTSSLRRSLAVYAPDGTPMQSDGVSLVIPDGSAIPEPQSMMLADELLVVTGKDHSVWIGDLRTGKVQLLAASGNLTGAAAVINGTLYLYMKGADQLWRLELSDTLQPDQKTVFRTVAVVTSTPVPTAVPTAAPSSSGHQDPGTDTGDEYDVISLWDTGSRVRRLQNRLYDLGYPVGSIDGVYGLDTRNAVNLFYDAIGSREHDYLSEAAEKKLYSSRAPQYDPYKPLEKGMSGTSVRIMQQRLTQLGYNPGKPDGIYGKQTVVAVTQFQEASAIFSEDDEKPGEHASSVLLRRLYADDAPACQTYPLVQWQETADGWICYVNGVKSISGWKKIDKTWYYFNDAGIMQTGWIKTGSGWYYADSSGAMLTGWQKVGKNWHYFDTNGKMIRGWFEDKQAEKKNKSQTPMWYYLNEDGVMVTGEQIIEGKTEVFNDYGLWLYSK